MHVIFIVYLLNLQLCLLTRLVLYVLGVAVGCCHQISWTSMYVFRSDFVFEVQHWLRLLTVDEDFTIFAMHSGFSHNQGHEDLSRGCHAACPVQQGSVHAPYMFTMKRVLPHGAVKCAGHQDFFTAV